MLKNVGISLAEPLNPLYGRRTSIRITDRQHGVQNPTGGLVPFAYYVGLMKVGKGNIYDSRIDGKTATGWPALHPRYLYGKIVNNFPSIPGLPKLRIKIKIRFVDGTKGVGDTFSQATTLSPIGN